MSSIFSAAELIGLVHETVKSIKEPAKIHEPIRNRAPSIPLADCIMSGLAIFNLKYPSLLQFETDKQTSEHNLKALFRVNQAPSDTQLRERLDHLNPVELRKAFKAIFAQFQRAKKLEPYFYLETGYLLPLDGTGLFSSPTVHCDNCCEKHHKDGSTTYYHQMMGGAIIHPDLKVVIPFAPEPIMKQDGNSKNDCERNASKRFLENLRSEHPHLKLIITEDGLSSNAPHIETLKALDMHFILGCKPGDHKFLFDWIEGGFCTECEYKDGEGTLHKFKFINHAPINEANFECKVNFIEYWEIKKNGKQHFSWVTDITITKENVFQIMKGGRARWKIENETFNTLKNQGYQFDHNFGHGYRYLSTVFATLMMLAFLIDQVQQACCSSFKRTLANMKGKKRFWEYLRNAFRFFLCDSWERLLYYLAELVAGNIRQSPLPLQPNTS